jgi:hypothetical protein
VCAAGAFHPDEDSDREQLVPTTAMVITDGGPNPAGDSELTYDLASEFAKLKRKLLPSIPRRQPKPPRACDPHGPRLRPSNIPDLA